MEAAARLDVPLVVGSEKRQSLEIHNPVGHLTLSFESFAFKDGIPIAADLVFDVRNLPNPHYDPALRPGMSAAEAMPVVRRIVAGLDLTADP